MRVLSDAEPATGNDLETYRQREGCTVATVDTGVSQSDRLGGAHEGEPDRNDQGTTTSIATSHRRIAFCECGAQLAGGTEQELFDAVQRHLAHRHPQLLGALELNTVHQMAETVGGH